MIKTVLISFYDPLSIGHRILHKILEEEGYEVYSIFLKSINPINITQKEIRLLLDKLKEIKPELVGISLRSKYFNIASKLTKDIKKELNTKVIWGGVHPTIKPLNCLEFADIVCLGEGEKALINLVNLMNVGKSINNIENLWIKEGGKIIKNDLAKLEENLDKIPFPDYSDSNKYYIENNSILNKNPFPDHQLVYSIMTSRGCPFNCSFCNSGTLKKIYSGKGKYLRRRSVGNVIDEIKMAKNKWSSIKKIYFVDDVFSFDIKWIEEFGPIYKKLIDTPFYCYVHPLFVIENTIKILKDAGLYEVNMGIQSGSERIRRELYHRPESNEQVIKAIKILNKYKIRVVCDLILGMPYETEEDRKTNLKLLMELPKPIILLTYNLLFFPNSLTEKALNDGLITEKDLEENKKIENLHWDDKFAKKYSDRDLFWHSLYYLASKGYSKKFINWCYENKTLKMNPDILVFLIRWNERKNSLISAIPKILGYIRRKQFKLLITKIRRKWF
ncbi:MAG: radical SAM protein [archaeon]